MEARTMSMPLALLVGLPLLASAAAEATKSAAGSGAMASAEHIVESFRNKLRGSEDIGVGQEMYTTNTACLPNYCLNPVIPGLMFLGDSVLEANKQLHWIGANIQNTKALFKLGGFCSRVIAAYPFAMPFGAGSNLSEAEIIQQQSYKALETYVGHLSGMGHDFWDHTTPWNEESECIKSVWKMACYTYFPRVNEIAPGEYLAPCRSSCETYLKKCSVQCCDEGTQCTFTHAKKLPDGSTVYEHGYPDHVGPSPLCTGGARRPVSAVLAALLAVLMAMWR
jgi:hypothetical protein